MQYGYFDNAVDFLSDCGDNSIDEAENQCETIL